MATLVMKFGGSSLGMLTAFTQVLSIVLQERERWERLVLVVSALEGVTDQLIEAAHLAQLGQRRGYRRIVATLRTRHLLLIDSLPLGANERAALQADIDRLLFDMLDTCQTLSDHPESRHQSERIDAVVGVGERLAARIIAALLRQNGVRGVAIDATDLLVTDNVYSNATVNLDLTRERIARQMLPMLDRQIIPVITGFIGATTAGKPTTLGRGGSDYTASVIAVCVDADEVWIWTNVDGMMSADPRDVPDAQTIPVLTYDEVAELSYFGARILHPRMIAPLRQRRIPARVRNMFTPQEPGTLIREANSGGQPLKAVATITGIGLSSALPGSLAGIARRIDEHMFDTVGSHAEVMIASQSSERSFACFVIPTTAGPDALHIIRDRLLSDASATDEQPHSGAPFARHWEVQPVTVVTAIGSHLDESPALTGRLFAALEGARVLAINQGASRCSLSFVVEPHDAERALSRLHALVVRG